jgi:hypothetical protein
MNTSWQRLQWCDLLVVGREDFGSDRGFEEVVNDLDAPLGAYPIPMTRGSLEPKPPSGRRLQNEGNRGSQQAADGRAPFHS